MPSGDTCAPTGSASRCARSRQPLTASSIDCETGGRRSRRSAVRAGMPVGPWHWVDGRPPAARTRRSEAERRPCRYLAETERAARERGLDVRPWRHSSASVSRPAALTRLLLRPRAGWSGEAAARTRARSWPPPRSAPRSSRRQTSSSPSLGVTQTLPGNKLGNKRSPTAPHEAPLPGRTARSPGISANSLRSMLRLPKRRSQRIPASAVLQLSAASHPSAASTLFPPLVLKAIAVFGAWR